MEHTTRICACDSRYEARADGEFVFLEQWKGWVFTQGTVRRVNNPWLLTYHETENHDGEPYVWIICPWCGGDLPPQDSFNPYLQSDGCSGDEGVE